MFNNIHMEVLRFYSVILVLAPFNLRYKNKCKVLVGKQSCCSYNSEGEHTTGKMYSNLIKTDHSHN